MWQEALLFAEQNGHAAPLSAGIKLRAKVVGGDAPSKAFVAATNRAGLSLNYDSMQLSDYRIGCVGTALKLYDQLGHSDISTTSNIYTHLDFSSKVSSDNAIVSIFPENTKI